MPTIHYDKAGHSLGNLIQAFLQPILEPPYYAYASMSGLSLCTCDEEIIAFLSSEAELLATHFLALSTCMIQHLLNEAIGYP
jgi:hypothetical protein